MLSVPEQTPATPAVCPTPSPSRSPRLEKDKSEIQLSHLRLRPLFNRLQAGNSETPTRQGES